MKVVNKHFHKATPQDLYVGRPSPLGNPYSHIPGAIAKYIVKEGQAIPMYRKWLEQKIADRDETVMAELAKITPETNLVCWCAPHRACHAEVIAELVEKMWARNSKRVPFSAEVVEALQGAAKSHDVNSVVMKTGFYQDLMDLSVHIDQSAS